MDIKFNPRLRRWMDGNNPDGGVALNKHFSRWNDFLALCLSSTDDYTVSLGYKQRFGKAVSEDDVRHFKAEGFKDLLDECKAHREMYKRKARRKELLVFVHPMYVHIMHHAYVEARHFVREGRDYYRAFKNVLNFTRGADIGMLLMETPQHYAAVTSLLMEQGFATDVVFTRFDNGTLLDENDAKVMTGTVPYFGGGYNDKCLGWGIRQAEYVLEGGQKVYVIRDLVVNAPHEKTTKTLICHDRVAPWHINNHAISLDDFMEKMKREKEESRRAVRYLSASEPALA